MTTPTLETFRAPQPLPISAISRSDWQQAMGGV